MLDIETNARLETATETLAEVIGCLSACIGAEEELPAPDLAKLTALRAYQQDVLRERKAIAPGNTAIIDRAIYVYAPWLKAMSKT